MPKKEKKNDIVCVTSLSRRKVDLETSTYTFTCVKFKDFYPFLIHHTITKTTHKGLMRG